MKLTTLAKKTYLAAIIECHRPKWHVQTSRSLISRIRVVIKYGVVRVVDEAREFALSITPSSPLSQNRNSQKRVLVTRNGKDGEYVFELRASERGLHSEHLVMAQLKRSA